MSSQPGRQSSAQWVAFRGNLFGFFNNLFRFGKIRFSFSPRCCFFCACRLSPLRHWECLGLEIPFSFETFHWCRRIVLDMLTFSWFSGLEIRRYYDEEKDNSPVLWGESFVFTMGSSPKNFESIFSKLHGIFQAEASGVSGLFSGCFIGWFDLSMIYIYNL